jgi:hypothetical protein
MGLILSEADSCRPQRAERDSLEHWEDDGGAQGTGAPPNPFSENKDLFSHKLHSRAANVPPSYLFFYSLPELPGRL